jgi:D-arabinose 1-dehydrogenase-like Zn-dependent alcohol dehydrogenase
VTAPGVLSVVERPISKPGAGQVLIRIEACGVCHTDSITVGGQYPRLTLPRVPGHEIVGRVEALGADASKWRIGQRVGGAKSDSGHSIKHPFDGPVAGGAQHSRSTDHRGRFFGADRG